MRAAGRTPAAMAGKPPLLDTIVSTLACAAFQTVNEQLLSNHSVTQHLLSSFDSFFLIVCPHGSRSRHQFTAQGDDIHSHAYDGM